MEFRSLFICCVVGLIIGFVCVLIPDPIYAADQVYENTYYQFDNDAHKRTSEQAIALSSSDPIYFFLFDNGDGSGSWHAFSKSLMTWVTDHTDAQAPKYYSPSGYSVTWSDDKACVIDLGYYYTREFNSSQKYTWYLSNYIRTPGLGSYERVYNFLLTGESVDFDFTDWNLGYSTEIGYLKGLRYYKLIVQADEEGAANPNAYRRLFHRFVFDSRSSSGLSLKNDTVKINVYGSAVYYYKGSGEIYLESEKVLIGQYSVPDLMLTFSDTDYLSALDILGSKFSLNALQQTIKGVNRSDTLYFEIVDSTLGKGDLLRVKHWRWDNGEVSDLEQSVVDFDGNLIPEDQGGFTSGVDTSSGFSDLGDVDSAYDDALKNALNGGIINSTDNAFVVARDLLSMIGNIPIAISKLFSFLPSWCLKYLEIVFVALGILAIYKLARG